MSDRLWVGLDLGTQSAKCVIVDDDGVVHARATCPLPSVRHHGVHTQDPDDWIRAASSVTTSAVSQLEPGDRSRLAGLATCSTSGTFAVVDREGRPRGQGVMYDDRRGAEHAELAADLVARADRLPRPVTPSWALPSMIATVADGRLRDDERFAHQADVVASAMVGHAVATDWSHALKDGYDLVASRWPPELAATGLSEDLLPQVVSPGTVLGTVGERWAADSGLPHEIPVYAGMTDGCAAQIGAGTVEVGDVHTVIGTTMVIKSVSTIEVDNVASGLYSHRSPDSLWYPGAASHAGAAPLSRFDDLAALLDQVARRYERHPGDILAAYPSALEGERFPFVHADTRGAIWDRNGHRTDLDDPRVDPVERVAAILLGLACVERLALERLSTAADLSGTLSTSGGASANQWLTRIRADLLGREIELRANSEAAVGMAVLACWAWSGTGAPLGEVTDRMLAAGTVCEPARDRLWADDVYERFLRRLREEAWI